MNEYYIHHKRRYDPLIISLFAGILILLITLMESRSESFCCFVLIALYLFLYIGKIKIYKYINMPCAFFVFFLTFVRYFLIPLLIIFDDNYMAYKPLDLGENKIFFYQGVTITIWELILFACFIYYKFPSWYKYSNNDIYINKTLNIHSWITIIFVLFGLLFIDFSVINDYSFVMNLKVDDTIAQEYVPKGLTETISLIACRVLKIVLPIPFIYIFYKKYRRNHSIVNYYWSVIVLVFFYAFIIEGNSRNSIIIPAVAVMFILLNLYPKYKRTTLLSMFFVILLITALSLIWKSFSGDYFTAKNSSFSYWISYIESYFAGISNMGKAVHAYQNSDVIIDPLIIFNDMFRSVPFFSSFTDNINTSSYYFVTIWGRTDQVIPATGNGLFYFGYLLAPLVPILILRLAHFFETRMIYSTSLAEFVIYCYSSIVISYNIFNSVSTMMMKLSITLIPLIFCLSLSKKMRQSI